MTSLEEKSDYSLIQRLNEIEVKKCKFGADIEKLEKEKETILRTLENRGYREKL